MLVRYGVLLTPKKADIFDMIRNLTRAGRRLEVETASWVFYSGVPRRDAANRVRTAVCQINDLFAATDIRIDGGKSGYRLVGVQL